VRTVYRYVVPVNDAAHDIELTGPIVHVASRDHRLVEFWAIAGENEPMVRTFQVFGTGGPLPYNAAYIGTTLAASQDQLVWHLFELLVGVAS
jgi:hypothetical protein